MATNKKTVIRKKIGNAVYNLLPQTSSDIVTHVTTGSVSTTVAALLNTLNDTMGTLNESTVGAEIDAKILAFKKEIYGVNADQYKTGIDTALDTIKEIADLLSGIQASYSVVTPEGSENPAEEGWFEESNGEYTATSDTAVDGSKTYYQNDAAAVVGLISKVNTLQTEVETASTGLLDRVSTIESDLNTASTGLKARVSALESFTTGQTTDDVPVGPNEDRNYVSTAEKAKIASSANVTVLASSASADSDIVNAEDLYFLEITAPVAEA
jgi:hypothetical protein